MAKNVNAKHSSTEPSDRGRAFSATDEDLALETDRKPVQISKRSSVQNKHGSVTVSNVQVEAHAACSKVPKTCYKTKGKT